MAFDLIIVLRWIVGYMIFAMANVIKMAWWQLPFDVPTNGQLPLPNRILPHDSGKYGRRRLIDSKVRVQLFITS